MAPAARWIVVAVVAALLASAPVALRAIPARGSDISAVALAARVRAAHDRGWSGEVTSQGSLALPLSGSAFAGLGRLLGGRSDLRVWWRGPTQWRVDRLRATGESDLMRSGDLSVSWSYESSRARFTRWSPVRLPDDSDLVPVSLAHTMLDRARPDELSRLPSRRIAGRSAAGLRLVPDDPRSTISRVEVWADDETGVPLRTVVYAGDQALLSTQVTSFSAGTPPTSDIDFHLPSTVDFSRGIALDEAAAANAFAPYVPPDRLAGLPRRGRPEVLGAVGVYGRGPTAVLAVPLRGFVADGLRQQLDRSPAATHTAESTGLAIGPLSVLLVEQSHRHYLLLGTVTPATLTRAAADLAAGVQVTYR